MSVAAIVFLAVVSLLLLTALVAFGVGHKRWSWVSVAAAFLVTLTLTGYLYLAARLLQFEWRWAQATRNTLVRIDEVRDAKRPSGDPRNPGPLEKIEGSKSLVELRQERDRWQRALERTSNWRGRHWDKAKFLPPANDGETGTIELPPPGAVAGEDEPAADPAADPGADPAAAPAAGRPAGEPLDPGDTVYVFDEKSAEENGLYLGAFRVTAVARDDATGWLKLTVAQTAPRDEYDRQAWSRAADAVVTVYDTLPTDRWLAFSETSRAAGPDGVAEQIAPQPAKKSEEDLSEVLPDSLKPEKRNEQDDDKDDESFLGKLKRHALSAADAGEREVVEEAKWPALREALDKGETLPGEAWAEFEFGKPVDFDAFLKIERGDGPEPESLDVEVELGQAFGLVDEGKGTIQKVFYRRRLIDAETLVHGSMVPGGAKAADLMTDGLAALMRGLQQDIAALDAANQRLKASDDNAKAELGLVDAEQADLRADLAMWERDLAKATKLADKFDAEAAQAAQRLEETERAVVELGRELDGLIDTTVREIDRVAPPPPGRGAAAPGGTF